MSASLAVKLVLTPALVVLASLIARRWGSRVGGWAVGFPFTSAPVALVLLLEHDSQFVATAAVATMLGVLSQAAFALVYAQAARRLAPLACLLLASAGFGLVTLALATMLVPTLVAPVLVAAGLTFALRAGPPAKEKAGPTQRPVWDLPARALVATAFVVALTAAAGVLGPRVTGLLTPFPLYASVLAAFAHVQEGPVAAIGVMRGLISGLYGFAAFFLALGVLVTSSAPLAFLVATSVIVVVQAFALRLLGSFSEPST